MEKNGLKNVGSVGNDMTLHDFEKILIKNHHRNGE